MNIKENGFLDLLLNNKSVMKIFDLERQIKLIWDFKGPDALETAKHHCIHLKEFAQIIILERAFLYNLIQDSNLCSRENISFVISLGA